MSTPAQIAIVNKGDTVSSIYLHFDGYPSYTLKMLQEHYNSFELAKELISHGNLSVLKSKINPTGLHTFENPEEDVCIYYGRDRGEEDQEPDEYWSFEMWKLTRDKEEYNYIFKDGEWSVV